MIIFIASVALLAVALGYVADAYRELAPATRPEQSNVAIKVYPFSLPAEPIFTRTYRTDVWGTYSV